MSQLVAIVDKLLTNVSSMYVPTGYISEIFLPKLGVSQRTGLLGKYGSDHLRIEVPTKMAGRGAARRVESITRLTSSYNVERHGLEGVVTEDDYANVEKPFDAERDEVIGLSNLIWLAKEKALADALTSTAIITQNTILAGASQYQNYATSDPIGDFKEARETVYDACGMPPNKATMSWNVFNVLAYHPGILEALGFTQNRAGQLSEAELAKAMGVDTLHITMAKYNSASEGQTATLANVWGNDIVFAVAPPKAEVYQTSIGYYLSMNGVSPRQVTKYKINNPPGALGIICQDAFDMFLSNTACGYLIKSAVA